MAQRALVSYGTKHGSTREVAEAIAETLRERGLEVDVLPADKVDDVTPYDGVVLGGAIYMGRWHPASIDFLRLHRHALAELPLAVFGMGPRELDAAAVAESRQQLDHALERVPEVHPVALAVFGGVVDPKTLHFPFNRMPASDARDWASIRGWAGIVGVAFDYGKPAANARDHRRELQQTPR